MDVILLGCSVLARFRLASLDLVFAMITNFAVQQPHKSRFPQPIHYLEICPTF